MHPRHDPSPTLLSLADHQARVLSTEQIRGHGLPRASLERLVAQGQWQRLGRGIVLTDARPPEWLALAWAGVLLGGPSSRLAGASAGHLQGLVPEPPRTVTVLVPDSRPVTDRDWWEFRRERPGTHDSRSPGAPPRTLIEDTVLDLSEELTPGALVALVTDVVQRRRTSVARLRARVAARPRLRHRTLLLELLSDVAEGVESPLELRYLRDVERAHGLPRGERQARTGLPFRRDVLYRLYGLVVELDGRLGHEGSGAFRDLWRDNLTVLEGAVTLRYGHHDVHERPCEVAAMVAEALGRLGWPGQPTRCHRCRLVA